MTCREDSGDRVRGENLPGSQWNCIQALADHDVMAQSVRLAMLEERTPHKYNLLGADGKDPEEQGDLWSPWPSQGDKDMHSETDSMHEGPDILSFSSALQSLYVNKRYGD